MGKNHSRNPGGQQRLVENALDTLRPGWQERTAKRKSAWNLMGALLTLLGLAFFWYGLWLGAWRMHVIFYPAHATHLQQFWHAGLSGGAFISSFLLLIPLIVPAVVLVLVGAATLSSLRKGTRTSLQRASQMDGTLI
jgi:hypothetical protein